MALSRFVLPFADVGSGIRPSSGAKLFFLETGTSTPADTFNCPDGSTANSNPVIADSKGVFPDIFLSGIFKVILQDKNGTQIWEADPVEFVPTSTTGSVANYDTLAAAVSSTILVDGQSLNIKERTSSNGGGGNWDVVLASSVTINSLDIVQATGVATLAIVLRDGERTSQFGSLDATESTAAIQRAIDVIDSITIDTDSTITSLTFRSSITVNVDGVLTSSSADPFLLNGLTETVINFTGKGKINGGGVSNTQNAIILTDCVSVQINNANIDLCLNKGIGIDGNSTDNIISSPKVRGATGPTGAGVSLFGATVLRNIINSPDCSSNRIGVTINGSHFNEVNHPIANLCTSSGVSIDGIISDSGDGGLYNKINHPICNDGTDATKGGVFCGNGSSYNEIIHPICLNNAGAGVRFSGGVGNENRSNKIIDPICSGNAANGLTFSGCPNMEVLNPTCEGNTGRGISEAGCDGLKIRGGFIDSNTADGILHQSPRTLDDGVTVTNNGAEGIEIAFGGPIGQGENRTINCHVEDNTGTDYVSVSTAKAFDLTGFVTDNNGSDTKGDGQTIGHGLSDTPAFITVGGSVASETVVVTARDATTFTVAVKTDTGAAGTSQLIDFSASLY